jgi:hypothetical protein
MQRFYTRISLTVTSVFLLMGSGSIAATLPTPLNSINADLTAGDQRQLDEVAPPTRSDEDADSAISYGSSSIAFTLEGRLFYNDLRSAGRFNWRSDMMGAVGTQVDYSATATNYLGAMDVVADIYEIDNASGSSCVGQEKIGSATVGPDGSFRKEIVASDPCGPAALEIAVIFRTRFCNSTRCFSVVADDEETVYRIAANGASPSSPRSVTGGTLDIGDSLFQTPRDDEYAMAANVYASIVDATRVLHRSGSIPFRKSEFGELYAVFPSTLKTVATTTGPDQIHIPMPATWVKGTGVVHEFGHALHMRTWDGTTGTCGDCPGGQYARDGDDTWGRASREYPHAAFSEGWANFVRRVVDDSCSEIDVNDGANPVYSASGPYPFRNISDGKSYAGNVTKLLCDWYDLDSDDDTTLRGTGDHFVASSIYSVWRNLNDMWDWVDDVEGLTICDYTDYYVEGRKGAAEVGSETHERYESMIADLAFNNAMQCGLPRP